jgi:alkanesulfonate monooxygenase SsuD/methylene tetrahydromethanopterin reductase-like flavin-dependent oxidoreductase (luciferase family)
VAQQASDVDLLSGGRLRLGVGIGWNYVEYDALGQDFATRGARVDEQIGFLRDLWTKDLVTFDGQFDKIDRGNILPRPGRSIPIWIGGFSEPAFRRGGRLGDGFIFAGDTDGCLAGLDRVKHHLVEAGRSFDGYGADYVMLRAQNVQDAVDTIKIWQDAGGTHVSVATMGLGFKTTEQHIDYIERVRAKLDG